MGKTTNTIVPSVVPMVCEFDNFRDIAPVESPLVLSFEEMLVTGVVPSDVNELEFSDAGDDANVITGKVTNVFQAMRVKNYILSNPSRPVMNVSQSTSGGSSSASATPVSNVADSSSSSTTSTTAN